MDFRLKFDILKTKLSYTEIYDNFRSENYFGLKIQIFIKCQIVLNYNILNVWTDCYISG